MLKSDVTSRITVVEWYIPEGAKVAVTVVEYVPRGVFWSMLK